MNASAKGGISYVKRNFDEAAILAVAAKLAFANDAEFTESEQATIAAMMRANPQAGDTPEALGIWLEGLNAKQIEGVVSNTKGVLHEMEFVRLENEDGDSIHASLFESTNHPGYDVSFLDMDSNESWHVQLKATDSSQYVNQWLEAHPDGEIVVTEELAAAMDLPSSGMTNGELTARTEDIVDRLIESTEDDSLWNYFPALSAASVAIIVWGLWQRYQKGELSLPQFRRLATMATGLRAGKLALLTLALSIPGLNVVTAAALVVSLIWSGAAAARSVDRLHGQ